MVSPGRDFNIALSKAHGSSFVSQDVDSDPFGSTYNVDASTEARREGQHRIGNKNLNLKNKWSKRVAYSFRRCGK
jgi:hypothetical protein